MQSHTKLLIYACLSSLTCLGFINPAALAQQAGATEETSQVSVPDFPYAAQITADNVNIRSGPGTNYYRCGRLNKNDKVNVVGSQFSWSRIVPPAGSFSWISKQYVQIDEADPTVGTVTGDAVRIYAGSEFLKPIHSTTVQLKFDRGDKVTLVGEAEGDYYKIAPPAGAYLWVSTKYTEALGPVGQVTVSAEEEAEPKAETIAVVPTNIPLESRMLEEYYALQKNIKAEQAKPIPQQNYSTIKKKFLEIADKKEAGKAARYADFAVKKIERFELALAVDKEVQLQDAQLQKIKDRIEKVHLNKLKQVPELGGYAVVGQFQTSTVYVNYHRVIDNSGKMLCYAVPSGPALEKDFSELIGRRVGLLGTIEPHPQTGGAIVKFTEIVDLQ